MFFLSVIIFIIIIIIIIIINIIIFTIYLFVFTEANHSKNNSVKLLTNCDRINDCDVFNGL